MATPAKRTASKSKTKIFEQTSEIDDDGNFTALVFGEEFKFSSDVNAYLLLKAVRDNGRFIDLIESLIVVEPEDGEKLEQARHRESRRFDELMTSQRNFSIEQLAELIADITDAAAGNEDAE